MQRSFVQHKINFLKTTSNKQFDNERTALVTILLSNVNNITNMKQSHKKINKQNQKTYDGMRGAGRACPVGRPCGSGGGAAPPGLFGIAGAGRPVAGGSGGPPLLPRDP